MIHTHRKFIKEKVQASIAGDITIFEVVTGPEPGHELPDKAAHTLVSLILREVK